ncbi:serine/threonine-protein kinase [Parafrankia colletiae]|nr:serine/threonine-protein kinase [Parafrankia colletiae]
MVSALQPSDPPQAGPYRLVHRIGSGGMGRVYLGVSPTAEKVAVKVVRSDVLPDEMIRARFAGEVDSLRMVFGSRVARFEGADLEHHPPWLAVEYVPGRTLAQHIELHGPLGVDLVAILAAMLCEGLAKVHEAGLLHRDLKPQNIMLGPDGPKIVDFGLAKLAEGRTQLTAPGGIVGTIAYMPPEQARGETDRLTTAADVYALGATLAHAATGGLLYPAGAPAAVLYAVGNPATPPDLSAVPGPLAPLVAAMVAFDPSARPSLAAVGEAMLGMLSAPVAAMRERLVALTYPGHTQPPEPGQLSESSTVVLPGPSVDLVIDSSTDAVGEEPADGAKASTSENLPMPRPEPAAHRAAGAAADAVDVSWLVGELRAEYARDAPF